MRWKQALRDQMVYLNNALLLNVVLNPLIPSVSFPLLSAISFETFWKIIITLF